MDYLHRIDPYHTALHQSLTISLLFASPEKPSYGTAVHNLHTTFFAEGQTPFDDFPKTKCKEEEESAWTPEEERFSNAISHFVDHG